jgi:putative membrane protein
MIGKFLIRVAINAFALFAAVRIVNIGMQTDEWWAFAILGLIFGVVNAVVRPILLVVGCPFLVLTLGLGMLLINTLLLALVSWIGSAFKMGFVFQGGWFWPCFLAALIVTIVSFVLNTIFKDELKRK